MNPAIYNPSSPEHFVRRVDRKFISGLIRQQPHDIARFLDSLDTGEVHIFNQLPPEVQAPVIVHLSPHTRLDILPRISSFTIARFLHFLPEDDAVDIVQDLPAGKRHAVMSKLTPDVQKKIEKLLTYNPETAGGIMDLNFILVPEHLTLSDITRQVKEYMKQEQHPPLVVITDVNGSVRGYVPYQNLIFKPLDTGLKSLIRPLPLIHASDDQEAILSRALHEQADALGVVTTNGNLAGIVNLHDLIRIVNEEATEDFLRFAGVSTEEEILSPPSHAIRRRYAWLLLNVATASIASFVVARFEGTIEQMAILAAFMPMVAGLGGNAGTQALAIVVRGLTHETISRKDIVQIIRKEAIAGVANGIIVGTVAAGLAIIITHNLQLGFVLASSLLIIITMSSIVGSLVPLVLKRFSIDPAVASSVFVTASIDVFGFLVFLGIATMVLL